MSYVAAGFPSAALAIVCLLYHGLKYGQLSGGIAIAALAATSAINSVLVLQILAGVLRGKVSIPLSRRSLI